MTNGDFQWRFVIADDRSRGDGTLAETLRMISDYGVACALDGQMADGRMPLQIIGNKLADTIAECHLCFVDMDWDGCKGSKARDRLFGVLKAATAKDAPKFGVEQFRAWCDDFQIGQPATGDKKNIVDVDQEWVGLWIAAAISHLNSRAKIVLYSSQQTVQNHPVALALASFNPAPYQIITKPTNHPLPEEIFFKELRSLQERYIHADLEVRRWVVGKGLLPLLFGMEPLSGQIDGELLNGRSGLCTLHARYFFPKEFSARALERRASLSAKELSEADTKRIDDLVELLPREPFVMSRMLRQSIQAVEHAAKKWEEGTPLSDNVFKEIEDRCIECGHPGQRILMSLQTARRSGTDVNQKTLLQAIRWTLSNTTAELFDLCRDNQGGFDCDPSDPRVKSPGYELHSGDRAPGSIGALPFDLKEFVRVLEALRDNLTANRGVDEPQHQLQSFESASDKFLSLTYEDNSMGFAGIEELGRKVIASAKDSGLERGLPFALSFPFFYPIAGIDVMTQDGGWHSLYPLSAQVRNEGVGRWRFGIRWTFRMSTLEGSG